MIDGYGPGDQADPARLLFSWLEQAGHQVRRFELAAAGFDAPMSAAEREAYHTDQPLIMAETREAAGAVLAARALVVCYPIVHGTAPARVKSWQERVFVLGLAFRFKPSGKITGALDHLRRALVVGVAADPDPADGARNAFGPCLARSFFLSSNRTCRSRYRTMAPAGSDDVHQLLQGW